MITVSVMSNPRESNGDLGKYKCNVCGSSTGAYVNIFKKYTIQADEKLGFEESERDVIEGTVCKGCLLKWVDMIDKKVLEQCKPKGYYTKCRNIHG